MIRVKVKILNEIKLFGVSFPQMMASIWLRWERAVAGVLIGTKSTVPKIWAGKILMSAPRGVWSQNSARLSMSSSQKLTASSTVYYLDTGKWLPLKDWEGFVTHLVTHHQELQKSTVKTMKIRLFQSVRHNQSYKLMWQLIVVYMTMEPNYHKNVFFKL